VGHRLGVGEDVTLQPGEYVRPSPTRHPTRPAQVGPLIIPKMPRWAGVRVLGIGAGLWALDEIRPDLRIPVFDSIPSNPLERTYGLDKPVALVPLVVLLAILAIDLCVYADARRWSAHWGTCRGTDRFIRRGDSRNMVLGLPSPIHLLLPALHGESRSITDRSRAARSAIPSEKWAWAGGCRDRRAEPARKSVPSQIRAVGARG
jgi:hypothetical protein